MNKSKATIIISFLLLWRAAYSQSPLSSSRDVQELKARNSTFFGDVNITDFPACAYPNCITSDQLSPSRLGCVESQLTTDCLCEQAPTPLSCSPKGPSDQDNCWADLEDWFAGTCNNNVPPLNSSTMPECVQDCILNFLKNEGCHAQTRNCFCILPRSPIIQAATTCYSANCTKKKASSFSPAEWHDNICNLGETASYDQKGYDSYVTMVHRVRLSMAILVGLISTVLVGIGISLIIDDDDDKAGPGVALIIVAIALVLLIIVPVYTAL
jgi:hypothetical protein